MNPLAWITTLAAGQGLDVSPELDRIIGCGVQDQEPFYFLTDSQSEKSTERMNSMYSSHRVVALGNRLDHDAIICLVVTDCDYPKGSVLVLHWDTRPGTEVDENYPSLAAWAKAAENDILYWAKTKPAP